MSTDPTCNVCGKPRWTAPDHKCKQCERHCKLNEYRRRQDTARGTEHDHTLQHWTCGCDPMLEGLKLAAEQSGNIEVRTIQPEKLTHRQEI